MWQEVQRYFHQGCSGAFVFLKILEDLKSSVQDTRASSEVKTSLTEVNSNKGAYQSRSREALLYFEVGWGGVGVGG